MGVLVPQAHESVSLGDGGQQRTVSAQRHALDSSRDATALLELLLVQLLDLVPAGTDAYRHQVVVFLHDSHNGIVLRQANRERWLRDCYALPLSDRTVRFQHTHEGEQIL